MMDNFSKYQFPDGISFKQDGVNEVDPCVYELIEEHRNVTVKVYRCKNCGSIDISWVRTENTEDVLYDESDSL